MRISYDSDVDAMYVEFHALDAGTAEARPLTADIIGNYGPDGRLAGLEILDASLVLGELEGRIIVEIAPAVTGFAADR